MEEETIIFHLNGIYLKDASFESPRAPEIFLDSNYHPKIDVELNISNQLLNESENIYEVVLKATIKATIENETAFLVEVQQAGAFTIKGIKDRELERVLESACPNALFPFLREQVGQLISQGGFPIILLQPVNFDAMYEHKKASDHIVSDSIN